ncbi:MAG TPA: DUF6766 family protein, partial [Cytophagales bacterium]|nr:DUF6766 family protein [Cytophagales bacterium]
MGKIKHSFFKKNGLTIVFLVLMVGTLGLQTYTGWHESNTEREEKGLTQYTLKQYLGSGHFLQTTFENWESEFLQMALYVVFTAFLYQQGSAESKSLDEEEDVDREPVPHKDAPSPVRKGGWYLQIYQNSLSIAFFLLFIISFVVHAYGTMKNLNEEGKNIDLISTFGESTFWFESFQNWQSEFLSVAAIVFLSIYLR